MNRLKFLVATFAITVLTLGIHSCAKEDKGCKEPELSEYDDIGNQHNLSLDYLASKGNLLTMSNDEKYKLIFEYHEKFVFKSKTIGKTIYNSVKTEKSEYISNYSDLPEWFENIKINLDVVTRDYMQKMIECYLVNRSDNNLLRIELRKIEEKIIGDKNVKDKIRLLGTFSVLKYSHEYWTSAMNNKNHPWHNVVNKGVRIDWARLVKDVTAYNDCLSTVQAGTYEVACDVCRGQAAYISSL